MACAAFGDYVFVAVYMEASHLFWTYQQDGLGNQAFHVRSMCYFLGDIVIIHFQRQNTVMYQSRQ
ncbi:hypothetical protein HanLR1_Chr10g0370741 [Helianthus annuus]|nr:hypothetical protein HanHA89_Chr10g0393301 [Helianthus annuus]KAJ0697601.1 hypothetical protein HanLR1_Chr10g0370741 [Helianthus annuus]